jgi:hypothetical protein
MTWLSRFSCSVAIALLVAACADPETTSLEGDQACGSMTCGDGQLCKEFEPHPNETLQYSCITISEGCDVYDCQNEGCPACVTNQCGYITRVEGRVMTCLGF